MRRRSCTTTSLPASCGDQDERACTIIEHIPSCKPGMEELLRTCRKRDITGFPTHCGDSGEPPCLALVHFPSCKSGLLESQGVCMGRDVDGFPANCGGNGEPDFGTVQVGTKSIRILTLKNDGTADLVLGPAKLSTATSEVSLPAGQDLCSGVTLAR